MYKHKYLERKPNTPSSYKNPNRKNIPIVQTLNTEKIEFKI